MTPDEFEKVLTVKSTRAAPPEQYARFVKVFAPLYHAGCSVPQLEQLFGVSKKFIRTRLKQSAPEGEEFPFRSAGPREAAFIPKPERIAAILKKHGLSIEDLPGPRPKRTGKSPKSTSKSAHGKK